MRKYSAFTLIELMVVIAIIAILSTAGITHYSKFIKNGRDTARIADLKAMNALLISETSSTGRAPDNASVNATLKRLSWKTFRDPANGATSCLNYFESYGTTVICHYEYSQCDSGGGYVVRTRFENKDNVGKYLDGQDGYLSTRPPSPADALNYGNILNYDIGSCWGYPAEANFVIIQ